MKELFAIFGWIFVLAMLLAIALPYLFRKSDLLTSWNLFLLGSASFIGYAAVQSAHGVYHYAYYSSGTYEKVMVGTGVFYLVIFAAYYLGKRLPRRLAGRTLCKWPPIQGPSMIMILGLAVALTVWGLFAPNIQGLGQIVIIFGQATSVIGIALALKLLLDGNLKGATFLLLIGLTLLALLSALFGGTSRRFLLSLLLAYAIVVYWLRLRSASPVKTLAFVAFGGIVVALVIGAYSTIRGHRDPGELALDTAITRVQQLPQAILEGKGLNLLFGSDSMECTLWIASHYGSVLPNQPFHTIKFILSNPIPRTYWPDKPEVLGVIMPRDLHLWRLGASNLGSGIVGQCFFEGGYFFIVFYAILYGLLMRYFDELLVRQPDNPYLLGLFGAASGQIVAFSRGDVALFGLLIVGVVLATWLIKALGRRFFGTGLEYPTDADRQKMAWMQ